MLKKLINKRALYAHHQKSSLYFFKNKQFSSTSSSRPQQVYLPVKKYDFDSDKIQIFKQPDKSYSQKNSFTRSIPYQIKQTTFKNFLILIVSPWIPAVGPSVFAAGCINLTYQITKYVSRMVTQMELMKNGKDVTIRTLMGYKKSLKIQDIEKQKEQKQLVQTWEQPFLFPIKVKGSLFYLYGPGQETIRDGELFRAVINGKNIKFQQ